MESKKQFFSRGILVFLLSVSLLGGTNAQINGVVVSDKEHREPISSAQLELESDTRGVLMPRMSFENMEAIPSPSDGLLVFVNGSSIHGSGSIGFYFYDAKIRQRWVKIASESGASYESEPIGTIVGFAGVVSAFFDGSGAGLAGTDYEGWHICNGIGGTPDLSGRFLVGAASTGHYETLIDQNSLSSSVLNDLEHPELLDEQAVRDKKGNYEFIGASSGDQSQYVLGVEQLPIHGHETNSINLVQASHTHNINVLDHGHGYQRAAGRRGTEKYPQEAKWEGSERWTEVKEISPDINTDDNVELAYKSDLQLQINFPDCALETFGSESPEAIPNEPKFYTLAYVIKTAPSPFVLEDAVRNDISFQVYSSGLDAATKNTYSITQHLNTAD